MSAQHNTIREGAGNKERILQCAEDLFCAKGYDAVGVQEIVDHVQVTKPTLYHYFGSKKGLLEELLRKKFASLTMRIEPILESHGGIRETLHALAAEYASFFEEEQQFYLLMMALFYSARENEAHIAIQPHMAWLYDTVCAVFERASGELGNMRGRQELFASSFTGIVNQYLLMRIDGRIGDDSDHEQLRAAVDQFMYGIFS